MKRTLIIFLIFTFSFSLSIKAYASGFDQLERFQINNPDGKKYEFVSIYLKALEYLKKNEERLIQIDSYRYQELKQKEKGPYLIKQLDLDNVNLRIARNMLKKNVDAQNRLMLKVSDIFIEVCDELIGFNNTEKSMLEEVRVAFQKNKIAKFDQQRFIQDLDYLRARRKEASKKLIEASFLITKLLVSPKTDSYGELVRLGVTDEQRSKLINKMSVFYGEQYEGELREGQTSLEGSIAVIRGILENYRWDALDG